MEMLSRSRRTILVAAMLTPIFTLLAFAEKPQKHPSRPIGAASLPLAAKADAAERDAAIHKAQNEIQKNPTQRKFILFRYGLHEEDLR